MCVTGPIGIFCINQKQKWFFFSKLNNIYVNHAYMIVFSDENQMILVGIKCKISELPEQRNHYFIEFRNYLMQLNIIQ